MWCSKFSCWSLVSHTVLARDDRFSLAQPPYHAAAEVIMRHTWSRRRRHTGGGILFTPLFPSHIYAARYLSPYVHPNPSPHGEIGAEMPQNCASARRPHYPILGYKKCVANNNKRNVTPIASTSTPNIISIPYCERAYRLMLLREWGGD